MNILKTFFRYAWAAKIALKIAWKLYKYRKDGYSREEIQDLLGTLFEEFGLRINQKETREK